MNSSTQRAIAYLKALATEGSPKPAADLSHADTPVAKDIGDGLLVTYLVDIGGGFSYV